MKQKRTGYKLYGLHARFGISLLISFLISLILFFVLYGVTDEMILKNSDRFIDKKVLMNRQFQSLQNYIDRNEISAADIDRIKNWENVRPVILLEIYYNGDCIYSSLEDDPEFSVQDNSKKPDINAAYVRLLDKVVRAELYVDFTYRYYLWGIALSIVISGMVFFLIFTRSTYNLISYLHNLNDEIHILQGGNLDYTITVKGNDEVTDLADSINGMKESFRQQMETEQRLHEANRRMISEMSHDLRTPLTGIMLYTEIIRSGRYSTDKELKDFVEKINAKARQMKELSDHLLEYSLDRVSAEQESVRSMEQALGCAVKDFTEELKLRGFDVVCECDFAPCYIRVKDEYIKRIFGNIVSNIVKYADPAQSVHLEILDFDGYCGFAVINSCSPEAVSLDSSGVGIESIRSMMKHMDGTCTVEQTESAFEIRVMFPKR